jgi:hypothetical protein
VYAFNRSMKINYLNKLKEVSEIDIDDAQDFCFEQFAGEWI